MVPLFPNLYLISLILLRKCTTFEIATPKCVCLLMMNFRFSNLVLPSEMVSSMIGVQERNFSFGGEIINLLVYRCHPKNYFNLLQASLCSQFL